MPSRPLWMVGVPLLGAAAALWGATAASWGDGRTGPAFTALALLAVASLAAVFAVSGWTRRVLGGIVAVAGGYVCWQAIAAEGAKDLLTGRGLALAGGVLMLVAGLLVVRAAATLPTMGARYRRDGAERRSGDPHTDMWDGLSHGEDPTEDGPRS